MRSSLRGLGGALNGSLRGLGGLGTAEQPPAKRQKKSDVLGDLGGFDGLSTNSSGSSASQGDASGIAGFGKSASKSELDAMKAWLVNLDAASAPTGIEGGALDDTALPVVEEVSSSSFRMTTSAAEGDCVDLKATEEPAVEITSSAREKQDEPAVGEKLGHIFTEATMAPARLSSDTLGAGWRSMFRNAKDCWHMSQCSEYCLYWHSETGCAFEWHQDSGTLFQYTEQALEAQPQKLPIWSLDCPEQHAWIWEKLPLPPTDPAAKVSETQESQAITSELLEATDTAVASRGDRKIFGQSAPAGADSLMPPPAPPLLKTKSTATPSASTSSAMPQPEIPVQKVAQVLCEASGDAASSLPKDNEVLDDNIWERRCLGLERRMKTRSAVLEASSSASAANATEPGTAGAATFASGEADLGLGAVEDDEDSLVQPPVFGPGGPPSFDDDEEADCIVGPGPLASEAPTMLPPAPQDRAKPKACDIELDIFGEPEENLMEAVD